MPTDSEVTIDLLSKLSPLDSLSESNLAELKGYASILNVSKGKVLFKRGQVNKDLFYLLKGSVDLLNTDFGVEKVSAPSTRSSLALDGEDPHTLTAATTSDVRLLRLSKDRLDLVLTWDQAGGYLVEDISDDDEVSDNDWMAALLGSQLFQQVPPANLQQLFVKFSGRVTKKDEVVVSEGDNGDSFYVVQSGLCKVTRRSNDGTIRELATLGPGQYFGEEALIGDTVRNATVTMATDGTVMRLGKEDFKKLLEEPVIQYVRDQDLERLLASDSNFKLLDVRLPVEIKPDERKSRVVIPLSDLRARMSELDSNTTYILSKEAGRRSVLGAYLINEFGIKALVVK